MKLLILRSVATTDTQGRDDYAQEFDTIYADRVIGNLRSEKDFCSACGPDCTACRSKYDRSRTSSIVEIIDFPSPLPYVLEEPSSYVPDKIPTHDVMLIINIHEQITLEILASCHNWGTKGVVVPLEAPDWMSAASRTRAHKICEGRGVEISFPKPFCAFDPPAGSLLAQFKETFHIGRPQVSLTIEDDTITNAHIDTSAACGATYYVAKKLIGRKTTDNLRIEVISRRLHSYPCTASMEMDPEIGDTPLHVAGEAHNSIISGIGQPTADGGATIRTPLGKVIPKPRPAREFLDDLACAKAHILERLADEGPIPVAQFKATRGISQAALSSALLLMKKDGSINAKQGVIHPGE